MIATQQGQAKTKGQQRKASEADPGTHIATAPMPIQNKRALKFPRPLVGFLLDKIHVENSKECS